MELGYRDACILTYTSAVEKFLGVAKSANPTPDDAATWHGDLAEPNLARNFAGELHVVLVCVTCKNLVLIFIPTKTGPKSLPPN